MKGQSVGQWILGEELGRGPVGIAYRAVSQSDPSRQAAVKLITHPQLQSPDFLSRFSAEVLPLHRLTHPNIASIYDAGVHSGFAWLASELVEGEDLASRIRRRAREGQPPGLLWSSEALPIAVQLVRALKHGHLRSLFHRGLKPSNVLILPTGQVKLTDFGLAKIVNLAPMNLPPDPWGTAGYLAPEAFQGKTFTRKSDLYALGGVLYTLLTGRPLFAGATLAELLHKHCYSLPERPARLVPELLQEVDDLVCQLLQKDPKRRPASAAALLPVLDHIRAKAERKGHSIPWPDDIGGTSAVLPALSDTELQQAEQARHRPWHARAIVLVPMLLAVVGTGVALTLWPRPSAQELFAQAQPLLASDDPADWAKALDTSLAELERLYPEQYTDEIQAVRQKLRDRKELTSALATGRRAQFRGEAHRLYVRGLKLAQAGELALAQHTWQQLITVFAAIEAEARWVDLAKIGLQELQQSSQSFNGLNRAGVSLALEQVEALKAAGKPEEAARILTALHELYDDDPAVSAILPKR